MIPLTSCAARIVPRTLLTSRERSERKTLLYTAYAMPPPLAYFLTWTCYGQHLHGDPGGSVDRTHNARGAPLLTRDIQRVTRERRSLRDVPVMLLPQMRSAVESSIKSLCTERSWIPLAINVRTTHVHIVVSCSPNISPERAMTQLKARATRDLRRFQLVRANARVWTRHGSTRWINHAAYLQSAVAYVNDWQDGENRASLEDRKREVRLRIEQPGDPRCAR